MNNSHLPLAAAARARRHATAVPADLDFAALADRYPMTGGHIRNAVLRAAFLAADEQVAITHEHLARGGRMELEGMGRIAA